MPLADTCRPVTFDDMVGQQHLIGPNGILRNMANRHTLQSVIFYGPPGTGKTTAALILAESVSKPLYKLNAVSAGTSDIKKIVDKADDTGCVLYLDEIQYFNKKQQQSLLPYMESGLITLIASTTENPYHDVYDAILSRCMILEFKPISRTDILQRLRQVAAQTGAPASLLTDEVMNFIAGTASGDVRRAMNTLELVTAQYPDHPDQVTIEDVKALLPSAMAVGFDKDGNSHYQYVSALQKSIRGSDPNAAVFYLAKLLEGGDILSPCRRLQVIAHEDIGLGNPDAIPFVNACITAAQQLGLPEAAKPLTNAVIYLAISRKCSTAENTYNRAVEDIKAGLGTAVPAHIRQEHSPGYLYPHDYPNHWVWQQYMPDDLVGHIYYVPGDNPFEQAMATYWGNIMSQPQNKLPR